MPFDTSIFKERVLVTFELIDSIVPRQKTRAWIFPIHTQGLGKPINGKVTSTQYADVH